jgi:protein-S-isoprenylcysteine O-methyltransferase Ste14
MTDYTIFCYGVWLVLFGAWMAGRFGNKRPIVKVQEKRFWALYVAYILLFLSPVFKEGGQDRVWGFVGAVVCLAGAGFALWARLILGKNWSARAEEKVGHSLVTTGPYAFVRHPIYTGFLFGMLGFALSVGTVWSLAAFMFGVFSLLVRIPVEEGLMLRVFKDSYTNYSLRTKKLIPFIW